MPTLSRIWIYPLKSFDAVSTDTVHVLPNGALEHDRRFALVDSAGRFMNAKRSAAVHALSIVVEPHVRTMTILKKPDGEPVFFSIDSQKEVIETWISDYFSIPLTLVENSEGGFPDDDVAPGPTVVSTSTLEAVSEWFPPINLDGVRERFRANLEVDGVEPFWEDRLFNAKDGGDRPFQIGDVVFGGSNPCQRCVVPSRDPNSGEVWPEFARRFSELREQYLPEWAARDRFNHFYRLSVNTRLIDRGQGTLRVGDVLSLVADR